MLIQFKVKNYLSFKDETVLDMSAIPSYKEHEYNLISLGNGERLNKVAAIYGANASGKSNLVIAFRNFMEIIIKSMNNKKEDEEFIISENYMPYFHDEGNIEFEITLTFHESEVRYGFEFNEKEVVSEWMYSKSFDTKKTIILIERDRSNINIGASIRKECSKYKEQIPKEALALSFFMRLKLKTTIFQDLYDNLSECLPIDTSVLEDSKFIQEFLYRIMNENKEGLLRFLQAIDTGIQGIFYEEQGEQIYYYTEHICRDGNSCRINLFNESQGTLKAIVIFGIAQLAFQKGGVVFMDEINAKLHPLLLKYIIDLFNKSDSHAQLIYTTHDTTLLDKKFLRRDQIWFVQKDEFGCSQLVALSDFKVRSDASFEKDYLAGVYGGIPFLKDF